MAAPRRFPLVQVDVFTDRPLEGNPLAVFTDARGLSGAEMQALAREMNLSETTFVLPRDAYTERDHGVRVRIFTVEEELPFAGHPTLGTAAVLRGGNGPPEIVLDLDVGRVPVRFEDRTAGPAFGEMRQVDPVFGRLHDRGAVLRATGLREEELDPALPIQTVSTGLPFVILPLRSLAALRALAVDWRAANAYLAGTDARFFYAVCRETVDPAARLHARMIFYGGEDPATGSAAGCAAAWMVANGVAASEERVLIEQGIEARRPSRIFVRAARAGERIADVRVGGQIVEVMRGELVI
jgi:trans-2,3-dihydro-3-hydroxyanthranilate isomerase